MHCNVRMHFKILQNISDTLQDLTSPNITIKLSEVGHLVLKKKNHQNT